MRDKTRLLFGHPLHVGRPGMGDRERFLSLVDQVLDRAWLTNDGPLLRELEQRLADYLGVNHCIATCNGTVALELAARALRLSGEVIVPSFTFVATAHALSWQGIKPIFCDIDPQSLCIAPEAVEKLVSPRTTGIVGVHLYGRACHVDALRCIADRFNLRLIFDAAQAFGCSHQGRMIGGFGDCEVFSFHATKVFNTFEGGAITTDDEELAAKLRLMRNFGFSGEDRVLSVGVNGKMSEVCAAMGLTNLEGLEDLLDVNRRNWEAYKSGLASVEGVELLTYDESERNNYQYIITEVDGERFGRTRDELHACLKEQNVLARRYFYPGCHRMEPYRSEDPDVGWRLPHTEAFSERVLALPTGDQLAPEEIAAICGFIRELQQNRPGRLWA